MIYLNTHPGQLNVAEALDLVSAQRREKTLRYLREADRRLSLAAYLLLQEALEKEYGITGPQEFSFGPNGKPFLRDFPHIHFNLSHCSGAALCVVCDSPVGCDIETVESTLDMDLCQRCCSPAELDVILHAPCPPLAFCTLWTRKEAFLKLTGEGLTFGQGASCCECSTLGNGSLDSLAGLLSTPQAASVHFDTHVAPDASFVYTVATFH